MKKISGVVKVASAACAFLVVLGAFGADRTWNGSAGDGQWTTAGNWVGNVTPVAGDVAIFNSSGGTVTVAVTNSCTTQQIRNNGTADVVININSGVTLTVTNGGGTGIQAFTANLTINGPGLLALSTSGGTNHLDCGADPGFTLAINAQIVGISDLSNTGIETWRANSAKGGTFILGCEFNAFLLSVAIGNGHALEVSKLAVSGQPSSLGAGSYVLGARGFVLRYTGTGDTTDRCLALNGGDATLGYGGGIEHAGTGILKWTGPICNTNNSTQTFTLSGSTSGEGWITGPIYNQVGTLAVCKEGTGTWVLGGNNTFTGGLTVNGGTLGLDSPAAFGGSGQIKMAAGTALSVNPSATDGFIITLPPIVASGNITVSIADAPTASAVTLNGLNGSFNIVISAPGAGTAANTIFVPGLPTGLVGTWLTLNGGPAEYDPVNGLIPTTLTTEDGIAVKGGILPDDPNAKAVIDMAAINADPIALTGNPVNALYTLTMAFEGDDAVVDTASKTLRVNEVAIAADAGALTIGVAPQDGLLLPPLVAAIPDSATIAALGPVIWYDPSDSANVTLNGTTVTGITNKGTFGAGHDAVVRSGWTGPTYVTGGAGSHHATLPMLMSSANSRGLQSLNNTGIAGNAPRTLIAVLSRNTDLQSLVSIGTASARCAFEVFLNGNANVRFGAYSADIDMTPAATPATPTVMVFQNGIGGDPNAYQGFADGVASTVRRETSGLITVNTPLHLMGRNGGSSDNYRGQIGEVLLFNRTLSDAERKAVEAYLMDKWQGVSPTAVAEAVLALSNDSAEPLTVNAAIVAPVNSSVSLMKTGAGDVTLAGGATLSGTVMINEGALALATPDGLTDTLSGTISGAGKLVKDGSGTLLLPYTVASLYTGGTDILDGVVRIGGRSLGTGDVAISGGATLDISGGVAADSIIFANRFFVEGTGKDGLGAIVNHGPLSQRNVFQNAVVQLTGNAAIGGSTTPRWDIAGASAILDLNGFTLTKLGVTDFRISPAPVINAPAGTALDLQGGMLGVETTTTFSPNDNMRNINIGSSGCFGLYSLATPINWTLTTGNGAEIQTYGGNELTNLNVLTGNVALNGTLHLTAAGGSTRNKVLAGQMSGNGGLNVRLGANRSMSLLTHPNNTFMGTVAVSNACLGLAHFGSLPDVNKLTLARNDSAVRVYMGGNGWTGAQAKTLAECGEFDATSVWAQLLQIHVGEGESASLPDISTAFRGSFEKYGTGDLSFDGDVTIPWGLRSYAGGVIFTNDATFAFSEGNGTGHIYLGDVAIGDGTGGNCSLLIGGNAKVLGFDNGYNRAGPVIGVAWHVGKSVVDVTDNAQVQSRLTIGGESTADTNAVGAVYQSGSSTWLNTGGGGNDSRIGRFGYGYYQVEDNANVTAKGYMSFGGNNNGFSVGMFRQTGGTFTFNGQRNTLPTGNNLGESYGGRVDVSRAGIGILHLAGGTFTHYGNMQMLSESDGARTAGTAIMTVAGANVTLDRQIEMGIRTNGLAILNLNSGTFTATHVLRRNCPNSTTLLNFNGGTFSVTNNATVLNLVVRENAANPFDMYVYAGGATIDLGANVRRTLDIPLRHPEGMGIASIALANVGTGYLAPPHVSISGGNGTGATAIAHINRATGQVTGIEITNPGRGYTTTPNVTFTGGGGTGVSAGTVTRTANIGGGLTKTGDGELSLSVANSYAGPTRIDGGILRLTHPMAIPETSAIIIGDGTLDLGGHTITNVSVTITGTGGIANGKVVTGSAVKTGPGTATWDAEVEFKAISGIPGLYEAYIMNGANVSTNTLIPNPCTGSIELTTTAANGYLSASGPINGKMWANYSTWIYTGYIWNRSPTNETWTFVEYSDDAVWLKIDDDVVLDDTVHTVLTTADYTLTPGPHRFEIRFGQGTGGVGRSNTSSWFNNNLADTMRGWGIDFLGRGTNGHVYANFVLPADPGDGSLFTATLDEPDTAIRVEEGTLLLPSGEAGLWEGWRKGSAGDYWIITYPNPKDSVQLTTCAGNIPSPTKNNTSTSTVYDNMGGLPLNHYWKDNQNMWIYTGYIWNRAETNETWTFRMLFDDNIILMIDDIQSRAVGNTHNANSYTNYTLTPGAHAFEVRFGDNTGSVGPGSGLSGLLVDKLGRNIQVTDATTLANTYELLIDPGDGSLFTTTPFGAGTDVLDGVTIDVADGATLDLNGQPRNGLIITGDGSVINSGTSGNGFILSPAGDDVTGAMSLDNFADGSLDGVTYRVTIHDPALPPPAIPAFTPGLWEGHRKGTAGDYFLLHYPNPKDSVQRATRAGNLPHGSNNTAPRAEFWSGNQNMWIYTGYIWNRAETNETWTFRMRFDDNVSLMIDGLMLHNGGSGATCRNYTLTPGPHHIEMRFGDNTGSVGAIEDGATGIMIDKLGRNVTNLVNFVVLEDPGDGSLFTLEAELPPTPKADNGVCDVINFTGAIDLTGLTITPSDLLSETPLKSKYIIATATGGFTGTPALEGFTDGKKWKALRKGNELWLTTLGGTVILLR